MSVDGSKKVRLVPIYLNGVRWKYMAIDIEHTSTEATMQIVPNYVEPKARRTNFGHSQAAYCKAVIFKRIAIPLRPDVDEIGYYGVDWNLQVNEHGHIIYDVPDDPEVQDGKVDTP